MNNMSLELLVISKKLPQGSTLESLYQINNQSIWFLIWILKKNRFWSDLIKEVLEQPFAVKRAYLRSGRIYFLKTHKNNEDHGFYRGWYENGQLEWERYWKNGIQDGIQHGWYSNGQRSWEYRYKDSLPNGFVRKWCENGQLYREEHLKDGKLDGIQRGWYSNGQLASEIHWKNGQQYKNHFFKNITFSQ